MLTIFLIGLISLSMDTKQALMLVGAKIRVLRIQRKWHQKRLAEELGKTYGFIANVEKGESPINYEIMLKLCEIFNLDFNYFDVRDKITIEKQELEKRLGKIEERLFLLEARSPEDNSSLSNTDQTVSVDKTETKCTNETTHPGNSEKKHKDRIIVVTNTQRTKKIAEICRKNLNKEVRIFEYTNYKESLTYIKKEYADSIVYLFVDLDLKDKYPPEYVIRAASEKGVKKIVVFSEKNVAKEILEFGVHVLKNIKGIKEMVNATS